MVTIWLIWAALFLLLAGGAPGVGATPPTGKLFLLLSGGAAEPTTPPVMDANAPPLARRKPGRIPSRPGALLRAAAGIDGIYDSASFLV